MLSEISQTQKDKYCMVSLSCGILKNRKNGELKSHCQGLGGGGSGERLGKGTKF